MRALALVGMMFLAATAWAVVTLPTSTASADPANDLLKQVQATYAAAPQLTARFEQTVFLSTFETRKTSTGTLFVSKPEKFRFDYDAPRKTAAGKSFIYDGKTLWVVEPQNLQVIKNSVAASQLPVAIAFWTGTADLTKDFTVTLPRPNMLELVPRKRSAAFAKLQLVVDGGAVKQSIVTDSNGDTNTFTFTSIDLARTVDGKFFTFDPKRVPTYRVVEPAP
jgi:outer membrane lipoprotein carrier protein